MTEPDFTITKLGKARLNSPLKLSTVIGDEIANFIPDDEAIFFNDHVDQGKKLKDMPKLEVAGPRKKIYFNPKEVRAAIVTCGGLCPGLNNVIRELVFELERHYKVKEILGIRYGYWGMIPKNGQTAIHLTPETVKNVHFQGGSFLGSSRGPQDVKKMIDYLYSRGINMLFTVGGDGTQKGALELSKAARKHGIDLAIVGIPKTIDNDLGYTERTFGYETACSIARDVIFVAQSEAEGARYGVALVKLMGRYSGFIAGNSALASGSVDFVLVPEVAFDLEGPGGLLAAIEAKVLENLHAVVVVAEGAGQDLFNRPGAKIEKDPSGNVLLKDIGLFLKEQIKEHLENAGISGKVRYIDPSYIIRSAPANSSDHVFCTKLAQNAVHAAMSGRTELVVGLWHGSFVYVPTAIAVSRRKMIDPDGAEWLAIVDSTGQPYILRNK